jgi:hypothetical protein
MRLPGQVGFRSLGRDYGEKVIAVFFSPFGILEPLGLRRLKLEEISYDRITRGPWRKLAIWARDVASCEE